MLEVLVHFFTHRRRSIYVAIVRCCAIDFLDRVLPMQAAPRNIFSASEERRGNGMSPGERTRTSSIVIERIPADSKIRRRPSIRRLILGRAWHRIRVHGTVYEWPGQ
jgi:hypothetical protein